ncbi:hypothetical protein EDE15_2088 [Edaphobacter aggregans]|uniref:Uncharacterized protein n=1 Tax=Edaphobacter aggregans TaxID=570835 RepID=A0A428MI33_9BACT|nr:hypothetical protein EDE15_2088 [Edaphobacter aggregans]
MVASAKAGHANRESLVFQSWRALSILAQAA